MGWERRVRGGLYYTRSRKVHGRVVREYIGSGPTALAIAQHDAQKRRQAAAERTRERAMLDRLDSIEGRLHTFIGGVEHLMRAELAAAGYHQHDRGEWRRRRGQEVERADQDGE